MGRRRRTREPVIFELIGPILALVMLLVFWASGFDFHRFVGMLQALTALLVIGIVVAVVGLILFLVIRWLVRQKDGAAQAAAPAPGPRPEPHGAPAPAAPLVYTRVATPWWERPPKVSRPPAPTHANPAADLPTRLRKIDWFQFEKLVSAVYQKQGYRVTRRGGAQADGGVDLIIEKDGQNTVVQCKHWRSWDVGVRHVRELLGALTDAGIGKGVLVTLRGYTGDARELADRHGIEIINEAGLIKLIVGPDGGIDRQIAKILDDDRKFCPKCENPMRWREPRGSESWKPFWGCSRYPRCHGKLQES